MKKNFSSQLFGQVQSFNKLDTLTGLDLTSGINPSEYANGFQKNTLFVDNCKTCNMKNFNYRGLDASNVTSSWDNEDGTYTVYFDDGSWQTYDSYDDTFIESGGGTTNNTTTNNLTNTSSGGGGGINWTELLNWGLKTGAEIYTNEQQIKLAEQRGEISQDEADRARAELGKVKATPQSENKSSIIKAYGLPIAITGVVIIAGIVTYFVVKKKTKQ